MPLNKCSEVRQGRGNPKCVWILWKTLAWYTQLISNQPKQAKAKQLEIVKNKLSSADCRHVQWLASILKQEILVVQSDHPPHPERLFPFDFNNLSYLHVILD